MKFKPAELVETIGELTQRFRTGNKKQRNKKPRIDRRQSKRALLRIPVMVRIGEQDPTESTLYDISPSGLSLEGELAAGPGDHFWVRFEGYPGVCKTFVLAGEIVRFTGNRPVRTAAKIDRRQTRSQSLDQYRKLVLHYLRHKPLLEEKADAFVEGRCATCSWVGRVSVRKPMCSRCGLRISDFVLRNCSTYFCVVIDY